MRGKFFRKSLKGDCVTSGLKNGTCGYVPESGCLTKRERERGEYEYDLNVVTIYTKTLNLETG